MSVRFNESLTARTLAPAVLEDLRHIVNINRHEDSYSDPAYKHYYTTTLSEPTGERTAQPQYKGDELASVLQEAFQQAGFSEQEIRLKYKGDRVSKGGKGQSPVREFQLDTTLEKDALLAAFDAAKPYVPALAAMLDANGFGGARGTRAQG